MTNSDVVSYLSDHRKRMLVTIGIIEPYLNNVVKVGVVGISGLDVILRDKLRGMDIWSIIPDKHYLEVIHPETSVFGKLMLYDVAGSSPGEPENKFDLVIFTEVMEHLFESDNKILRRINHLLVDSGLLVISVPNATTFLNRARLLFGKNIYWDKDRILHGVYGGFGHIREYTFDEMETLLKASSFDIVRSAGIGGYRHGFVRMLNLLPKSYANTILYIARKSRSDF